MGYSESEKNGKNTSVANNKKQKYGLVELFRLFHLKFWILIIGLLIFESFIAVFHPEIATSEAFVMLLITVPIFILLTKRHKKLKQYFSSVEYEHKKEEKRRIKINHQYKAAEERRKEIGYYRSSTRYEQQVSNQKDSNSGCCLVALLILIFYAPFKLLLELTRKYN